MAFKPATTQVLESAVTTFLAEVDDPQREGLAETPRRHVKFLQEFLAPRPFTFTTFEAENNELIIQTGLRFFSLCEHHLAPFFGTAAIAYRPEKRMVGLSKLGRVLEMFSRRLQNQERITQQIVDYLAHELQTECVGAILQARHLCMSMRGVAQPDAVTTTTYFTPNLEIFDVSQIWDAMNKS